MKIASLVAIICCALVMEGCVKDEGDNATGLVGGQTGTLVVRLTDAPGAYDAVNISVDSVRVHIESADSLNGWYTISRAPAQYNLLEYTNGRDTVIAEASIPAGYYSQIRLHIGGGSHIVKDGVASSLEIPSGSQSGLKLNIQANVLPGVKYEIIFDFDASRSIVVTGNRRYLLKPVIKVASTAVSGSLSGTVLPDTANATAWAIAGTDTSTTLADTTGLFRFKYLAPAMYLLKIVPADVTYRDTVLTNIAVAAAKNTDVGMIHLQKK